jgi:DNA repair protein SbcC/Rad50
VLLQVVRDAPSTELKLAALQGLTQEDSFKDAMHEFRERDKRLYRAAKMRWQAAREKRAAIAETGALIAAARGLLDQELVPANRVVELDRAWAVVNDTVLPSELREEFAALREQLGARLRARGEGEQTLTLWLNAAGEAIDKLSASLAGVAQGSVPPDGAQALAASLLELLSSAPELGDARRSAKTDAANRVLALASSVVERVRFLQMLPAPGAADEADEKSRIQQWREFPEVSEGELHTVLASRFADWRNANAQERQLARDAHRAHERQKSAERNQQHSSAVERDVEAAEAAQAEGHVADLARLLATIDQALKRGPVPAALKQRIDSLRREHLRLRHWQRWGGGQRREELAAEAQELARAAAGKVSIQEHAEAITRLRERWKELDKLGAASKQAVWLTFDGALKTAYAPVAAHLEKLKHAREENLAARNRIVDGLVQAAAKLLPAEDVAQGADNAPGPAAPPANTDWRAVARTLEEAQVGWRKLGPVEHTVPRKALQGDKSVTGRYSAAVQALEARLEQTYGEARRQREQLIASAKDLAGSNVAARDVVDKVRRLQAQWQAVAKTMPLPRRDEGALWTAFKTATDAIFAARDAGRAAKEAEFSARIKAREEIIERLAALPSTSSAADIKRAMAEADRAWRACAELPRPQASKLEARYRAAREATTKRLGEIAARASQARFDALIAMMELCREREAAQDAERALTDEQASDLEARWNAIENIPEPWKARMEARFRGIGLAQADPASVSSIANRRSGKTSGEPGRESLPDTLINLEVACGLESPGEFLAARQQLKLRALKAAMEGRQTAVTTPADIERWMLDAASTPRPDEVSRERMRKIIAAVKVRSGATAKAPSRQESK